MGRIGFEKRYLPGVQVGRFGWERSFESGTPVQTGAEGILYAPSEVNHVYPKLGLEQFLSEVCKRTGTDVELWLTTTVYSYQNTQRIRKIKYKICAFRTKMQYDLYEASIHIEDRKTDPLVESETKELLSSMKRYQTLK